MDVQGETILGTYLYGGGVPHDIEDANWTAYMTAHQVLAGQILIHLRPLVQAIADRKKLGQYPIFERFHAEFPENSGFSGYALLHGSNKDVGDFVLSGSADVQEAADPADDAFDIELDLRFAFNDMVDPNGNYWTDTVRNWAAQLVTFGQATSYRLSIHWGSSCLAEVRPGREIYFTGYPSAVPRSVRVPLNRLDWIGLAKKRAKAIEAVIIKELQRAITADDTDSQADRRRRLLWLFYLLGENYYSSTYLDRISNPSPGDDLPRLLRERISGELQADLLQALRGKRPDDTAPPEYDAL